MTIGADGGMTITKRRNGGSETAADRPQEKGRPCLRWGDCVKRDVTDAEEGETWRGKVEGKGGGERWRY